MPNPNIPLGSLNRLRGSAIWADLPDLNVTASFLGLDGIRLALEGEATQYFPVMAGAVTSGEPYQMVTIRIPLLKTQPLSAAYKAQFEANTKLGDGTITPDVGPGGITPWPVVNCSLVGVQELELNGQSPVYMVSIRGYYEVNSSLWDL